MKLCYTPRKGPFLSTIAVLTLLAACLSGCGGGNGSGNTVSPPSNYEVTIESSGTGALGDGDYPAGARVIISAGEAPDSQQFKNWTASDRNLIFADPNRSTTAFTMPSANVTVTAHFEPKSPGTGTGSGGDGDGDSTITGGGDGDRDSTITGGNGGGDSTITGGNGGGDRDSATAKQYYAVTVSGNGTDMTGDGHYKAGDTVTVTAGTPQTGYMFKNWTTSSNGVTFADSSRAATTFVMPANAVTVTAVFEAASTTNPTYKVTVSGAKGATGGGTYTPGMIVNITAGTDSTGQQFKNWTTTSDGVTFINANSSVTSFNMPANNVTVTAVFDNAATYAVTVSGGTGATGSGRYVSGKVVSITAGTVPAGQRFKNWTTSSSGVTFANANSATTTFTMPSNAVTVTANFEAIYTVTVSSAGTGATGGGTYAVGATVSINAGTAPAGQRFKNWTTSSNGVTFANANSASTSFTMPENAVTVTAVFETIYTVTVSGGTGATGGGSYAAGATVSISAGTTPAGQVFNNWTTSSNGVTFANANNASTSFTMPSNAVTVTANFLSGFTDARDSKFYKTVTIGGKKWMAENLNYQTSSGSWCYQDDNSKCNVYGRLYDWATAMTVCPTGWHLPSRDEWGNLAKAAGGTGDYGAGGTAGKALKATSGWNNNGNGTDNYGFSALPGGYRSDNSVYAGDFGRWWTATVDDSSIFAYGRNMYYSSNTVSENINDKSLVFSVRCVAD
ncbi:MAG: InlB B-repeat-containing protein [Chitinispirillales bacterium]|jgi:uncharacterized protein (TIGR02145 family)|nr:InlB B-repeat-containing protein [Chitinispirillales bacterium]